MTGEVISRVPLASKAEVHAAVENAIAAQAAWAATNPQRRARVLMKFLELVARAWPLKSSSERLTPTDPLFVEKVRDMHRALSQSTGARGRPLR
jgi:acyl-CoA reductase-like NAD-dependent aldehyde dehydrogenase